MPLFLFFYYLICFNIIVIIFNVGYTCTPCISSGPAVKRHAAAADPALSPKKSNTTAAAEEEKEDKKASPRKSGRAVPAK